ncbi:hypothetical protein Fleli_1006 [Bernardetia litoralis DSM 6794]|uniref:Uncharacterized protein n=1 Tax=Bernardetia litoralis (strain ATCC 23117 / DSM 6794 / NBRC 15988 / NCIMB 1366 / Fx l1 / Sio-4) TaxID=880071 RepID=I4AHL8_BERLS|nr:hypothetical protein [Bernardetia litoralis]AFM03453.1 hypothetical protein Fleli_1006 [Bernardetia litoralis DSM 6794]
MHIHKISNQKHIHFLKEERKDPITGDLILEGDEVVFCANCKSAFLKSSWEYIGKRHCESKKTLYIFPHTKTIRIGRIFPSNFIAFIVSEYEIRIENKVEENRSNSWKKEKNSISIHKTKKIEKKNATPHLENFDLDKISAVYITFAISFIICILTLLFADLTIAEQDIMFIISSLIVVSPFIITFLYQKLGTNKEEITTKETEENTVLFFESDKLGIYLHDEKTYYSVNYKEISQIKFYYPASVHLRNFFYKIKINTIDGKETSFELENKGGNKSHFLNQTESIAKIIHSNSKDTLIIFKVSLIKSIFYELNEMKNNIGSIRTE